MNKGA